MRLKVKEIIDGVAQKLTLKNMFLQTVKILEARSQLKKLVRQLAEFSG